MSVTRPRTYAVLTGGAAVIALSVAALASPAVEPAAAVGTVQKPLPPEVQAAIHTQVAADDADQEATRRKRAEMEDARAKAELAAAEQAAREAARAQVLANADQDPKAVAELLLAERGMGEDQFQCLVSLWEKESNWRWNADNPTSSAYGIPQALPGHKMSTAGADWETNPVTQIRWGIGYIEERYGSPCKAWNHSQAVNWY